MISFIRKNPPKTKFMAILLFSEFSPQNLGDIFALQARQITPDLLIECAHLVHMKKYAFIKNLLLTLLIWGPYAYLIFTKFPNDCVKIVDFSKKKAYFSCVLFFCTTPLLINLILPCICIKHTYPFFDVSKTPYYFLSFHQNQHKQNFPLQKL